MKVYPKLFKLLIAFFLILVVPVLGFAEDVMPGGSSPLWDMFKNLSFAPPVGDISVGFLTKMFGAVPGVPQLASGGQTILGVVFGVFNVGVLALSGVFLSYTITRILTETTMDGAAIGKSTTIWTAVRCSLSTSLLVPQASGYSLINSIIMWVVIQSIGLADLTWSAAMEHLKRGGRLYAPPTSIVDYSLINYDVATGNNDIDDYNYRYNAGSTDILRSLTCSYIVHNALVESQKQKRQALLEKRKEAGSLTLDEQKELVNASRSIPEKSGVFSLYKDFPSKCTACNDNSKSYSCVSGTGVYQFPHIENESSNPFQNYGLNMTSSDIPNNLTGICGAVKYSLDVKDVSTCKINQRYVAVKKQGLDNMLAILDPTAKSISEKIKIDPDTGKRGLDSYAYILFEDSSGKKRFLKSYESGNTKGKYQLTNLTVSDMIGKPVTSIPNINWPLSADSVLSAAAAYQIAVAPAQSKGVSASSDNLKRKFEEATKQGWVGAGGYYRLLAIINKETKLEYGSYRLLGYKDRYTPVENYKSDTRLKLPYDTMFTGAISNAASESPIAKISSEAEQNLEKALEWIYLSYPYARLHGEMLHYALTKTTGAFSSGSAFGAGERDALGHLDVLTGTSNTVIETIILNAQNLSATLLAAIPPVGMLLITPIPMVWLSFDVLKVLGTWWKYTQKGNYDPIMKLQHIGGAMIEGAVSYARQMILLFETIAVAITIPSFFWTGVSIGASMLSTLGVGLGTSEVANAYLEMYNSLVDLAMSIMFMYVPIGIAIMGPMFISGVIFSVYVPLIPYLLFLFGVLSWFISVLVLMAAAPIICFLMLWGNSSQENPLLAREAEQFVMQVVGVFFRPTLMVIGLVTGMVLSYIGVDLLNMGFANILDIVVGEDWGTALSNVFSSTTGFNVTGVQNKGVLFIVKLSGVIIVYTFTMVSIVNMAFSPIYVLYSEAMRIAGISAPAVGMEEKAAEAVKGGVSQFAEAGAAGMKETATSIKGAGMRFRGKISAGSAGKGKKKKAGAQGGGKGASGAASKAHPVVAVASSAAKKK